MDHSRPNIILLSIDALRADHLSFQGYDRKNSLFLETLAEKGAMFEQAFSVSTHTREGLPSLLTGQWPIVFAQNGYQLTTESLATRLSDAGYRTGGFHSNSFVSHVFGFDEGFDEFYDDLVLGRSKLLSLIEKGIKKFVTNRGEYHARADEINRRSLNWIDSLDGERPFFLWNHYMDVHGPYNPPDEIDGFHDGSVSSSEAQRLFDRSTAVDHGPDQEFTEDDHRTLVDLYDGEICYLDAQLRILFRELEDRGLLEESYVILTADHGEAFGEHGDYGHPRYLHDELLQVPLVVLGPNVPSQRVATCVSTLDVAPSILQFLDLDISDLPGTPLQFHWSKTAPDADLEGQDAVIVEAQGQDAELHKRRFGILSENWKYTMEWNVENGELLSESQTNRGDGELNPEVTTDIEMLQERLMDHCRRQLDDIETVSQGEYPEELSERLEALGYK